jgi:hypothetical protein
MSRHLLQDFSCRLNGRFGNIALLLWYARRMAASASHVRIADTELTTKRQLFPLCAPISAVQALIKHTRKQTSPWQRRHVACAPIADMGAYLGI